MHLRHTASCCLLAFAALALVPPASPQQALPPEPHKTPLELGAAWYPEQWPEARWNADLQLMRDAGITFVRVGEFAWSTMEPKEGDFELDWLDRAIRDAEKHGIAVVIGTPTAAPPAWLTQKYPETLRTMADGRKDGHGGRQQFDWSDPKYRELCRIIATKLAERFGHDPDVIGWQIDNEYANESYGPATDAQFQAWLKTKYKTLDNLNTRWTTAYWSETYEDWNQIPIEEHGGNPGLMLNWKEFVSDTWRSYQRNQIDAIRPHADPRQFITTNMMGWFDAYDHYTVAQDLDLASWDDYVGEGQLDPVRNGATHDLTRGFLRRNFWVMETQPGHVNWAPINNSLNKGETRAMAWNAIGHGAEAVEYWQWRSALNGQEQYHGTLLGPDGTPVPLYDEVKSIGAEFAKAAPVLAGTTVDAQVAVLQSYDSRWAINWQRHNKNFDPVDALMSFYRPLHQAMRSVDIVADTAPLSRYKLVVAPALNLLTPAAVANLEAYARGGGHLVLGTRSGMKDEDNSLFTERQPGPLVSLLGARVEQYYALDKPVPLTGEWAQGSSGDPAPGPASSPESTIWAELLGSLQPGTEVPLRYGKSDGWLDGQPAAVTRKVGAGQITYLGAYPDAATMKAAVGWLLTNAGLAPVLPEVPVGVDVALRSGEGKRVLILTNYNEAAATIALPGGMRDVLHGGQTESVTLPQYGVAVLETTERGRSAATAPH